MKTGLGWLNQFLSRPVDAAAASAALIDRGFPIESQESITTASGVDSCLDVEITSNRGDCVSHAGLAREIAASFLDDPLPITYSLPALSTLAGTPPPGTDARSVGADFSLENTDHHACPLFVIKVIRGVRVAQSPSWLRALLESAGQRPINNIVDATNFIALELGNPCHAFDASRLDGKRIVVRPAHKGERLTTLDGKERSLHPRDIVVADAARAQSLAGVMGGASSEVTASTTDVVLEMATWDPVRVRETSRRHGLRTTASYRYERTVDPRTLHHAAERCAQLIALLGGGRVAAGIIAAGADLQPPATVALRPPRCAAVLGVEVGPARIRRVLSALGIEHQPQGEALRCTIPPTRPDLTREIDLIEEVARVVGLNAIPTHDKLPVRVTAPQPEERRRREIETALAGLGFFEAVSFSFCSPTLAKRFLPADLRAAEVSDDRRGDEPTLRPSVLTGLLASRRHNQHAGVGRDGGVRLFEIANAFALRGDESVEHANLALLLDAPAKGKSASHADLQSALRLMRGAIDAAAGDDAGELTVLPSPPHCDAFDPGAYARVLLRGQPLGYFGLIAKPVQAIFDLALPVVGAELRLAALLAREPSTRRVFVPPAFPGIERDVSLIVDEPVRWDQISSAITAQLAPPCEHAGFVGTFRGGPIPAGKKSVTVRLSFRDESRTLTHQEVDGPVAKLLEGLRARIPFELRA